MLGHLVTTQFFHLLRDQAVALVVVIHLIHHQQLAVLAVVELHRAAFMQLAQQVTLAVIHQLKVTQVAMETTIHITTVAVVVALVELAQTHHRAAQAAAVVVSHQA
jgi:hypothetical protein